MELWGTGIVRIVSVLLDQGESWLGQQAVNTALRLRIRRA
jgi:hypothetical protein